MAHSPAAKGADQHETCRLRGAARWERLPAGSSLCRSASSPDQAATQHLSCLSCSLGLPSTEGCPACTTAEQGPEACAGVQAHTYACARASDAPSTGGSSAAGPSAQGAELTHALRRLPPAQAAGCAIRTAVGAVAAAPESGGGLASAPARVRTAAARGVHSVKHRPQGAHRMQLQAGKSPAPAGALQSSVEAHRAGCATLTAQVGTSDVLLALSTAHQLTP